MLMPKSFRNSVTTLRRRKLLSFFTFALFVVFVNDIRTYQPVKKSKYNGEKLEADPLNSPLTYYIGPGMSSYVNSFSNVLTNPFSSLMEVAFDSTDEEINAIEYATNLYRKNIMYSSSEWFDKYTLRGNLLKVSIGANKGQVLSSVDDLYFYDSDPRLMWSIYFDHLTQNGKNISDDKLHGTIPFSWYDFADFHELNKLISIDKTNISCNFLLDSAFEMETLLKIEEELGEYLFTSDRFKYDKPSWYLKARQGLDSQIFDEGILKRYCEKVKTDSENSKRKNGLPKFSLPFAINSLHDKVKPEVFQLQSRNQLLSSLPNPLSLTFLNHSETVYRVNIDANQRKNIIQSKLLENYMERNIVQHDEFSELFDASLTDHVFDHFSHYDNFLNSPSAKEFKIHIPGAKYGLFDDDILELSDDEFYVDVKKRIEELEDLKNQDKLSLHEICYLESIKNSIRTHPVLMNKYFIEPGNVQKFGGLGHHRDGRFFNGAIIDDPVLYAQRMNSLIRTFQKFTKANGLVSWLAHGTLYGYLYNGETFPWDNDFDLQMPIRHLHLLSQHFNQSLIMEDPREGNGRYFLDVGNSITVRTRGNNKNNIDARFIDVDAGLYIDLTGMSVSSHPLRRKLKYLYDRTFPEIELDKYDFKNLEIGEGLAEMNVSALQDYKNDHSDKFNQEERVRIDIAVEEENKVCDGDSPERDFSPDLRYLINRVLKFYNCRNEHSVPHEHISPLINTYFHGVPTLIPRKYIEILKVEYRVPEEIKILKFNDKMYIPKLRRWFKAGIVNKGINPYGWFPKLATLGSPLENLELEDIKTLYLNFVEGGYKDEIGMMVTSFDVAAYRIKEVEIMFDMNNDATRRRSLLHTLRTTVGPKLYSPYKDPYMYTYEKRLFETIKETLSRSAISTLMKRVNLEAIINLWERTKEIKERALPLFQFPDFIDLNKEGIDLFHYDKTKRIFKRTPELQIDDLVKI